MQSGEMDILKIILESGFVVKAVLISLIISSIVSWAIVLKKKKAMSLMNEANRDFMDIYHSSSSLKDVMSCCDRLGFSPYKALFVQGFTEFSKIRETFEGDRKALATHFQNFGLNVLERAMKKGVHEVDVELEKFLATLASIASVAPFVGLFGTVWGIIDSFTGLAGGGATLDAVAPGIAEALVATAVGLAAAIPAVWFYNHFNNDNQKIHGEMESFGQEFLNVVERSIVHK